MHSEFAFQIDMPPDRFNFIEPVLSCYFQIAAIFYYPYGQTIDIAAFL